MKDMKNRLAVNLKLLRRAKNVSQETVAEAVGVSRQAIAKWENDESVPDIANCCRLAAYYAVSLDDLVQFDALEAQMTPPPKGKHVFGSVTVGERGQIVIPKRARDILKIEPGDQLMVLGDEDPENGGLALVQAERFLKMADWLMRQLYPLGDDD